MRLFLSRLIIGLFFIQKAIAQQPVMRHYTVNDGLPSSEVYSVMQDKKGYIWFSTDRGVARFDGYTFKTYTTDNGLCDNTVFDIYEDQKERLWFRTYSGKLCRLEQGNFVSVSDSLASKNSAANHGLYVDKDDTLWVGLKNHSTSELMVYPPGYKTRQTLNRDTLNQCEAILIKEIKSGFLATYLSRICLPNEYYAIRLVDSLGKVFRYQLPGTAAYYVTHQLQSYQIIRTHAGNYLLSAGKELVNLDQQRNMQIVGLGKETSALYEDINSTIWIGHFANGVSAYSFKQLFGKKTSKNSALYEHRFLQGKSVTAILQDREGGYWFTTLEDGVYYLPSLDIKSYTIADGLQNNKVLSITGNGLAERNIYIGLQDGWINKIEHGKIQKVSTPPISYKGNVVLALLRRSNGELWCGTTKSELYHVKRKQFIGYGNANTKALIQTDALTVWAAHTNGLAKYTINATTASIEKKIYSHKGLSAYTLCKQDKRLWIGTINGLYSFDNQKFRYHGKEHLLLANRIVDIKKSSDGCLWMATRGAGIIIKNKNKLRTLSTKNGLANNLCNSLYITGGDTVWVATNSGLSRIVKNEANTYQIKTITTNDGLASNEVNQVYQSGNKLWVATNSGLSVFDIHKLKEDTISPPVYITGININEEDTVLLSAYHLEYDQNNLQISFVGLSYKNPGKIWYKYRLEGLDTTWIYTTATSAQFIKLPSGSYTFRVVAMNAGGYAGEVTAFVSVFIATPYWKTIWFRLSIILAFAVIVIGFIVFRLRQILSRNKLLYELNTSKQQALAAQMEPHFVFNSLNSIQNYILQENKEAATNYLTKLAKLIRMTLDHSLQHYITLEEELAALKFYLELEKLRFKDKFTFTIVVDADLAKDKLKVPGLIIQPYAENSILHGIMPLEKREGKLEIIIQKHEQYLLYIIRDNGIGRKQSALKPKKPGQHKSVGMSITQKRIELINAVFNRDIRIKITDMENREGQAMGTQVEVVLPIIS